MVARENKNTLKVFWERLREYRGRLKSNVLLHYIAKELFLYFLVCFSFFFVVFFVNQILLLAETILKKHVPVGAVLRIILYCLPAIIAQSAPFATLVGFLMCLGRMVTDNEILILRASGQRYSIIFLPVIIMGVLISLFSFVMNDYFLPLGTLNYNKLYREIIASNPAVEIESQSVKRMENSTLVIGNADKEKVDSLVLFDNSGNGEQKIIIARDSEICKSGEAGVLMELKMNGAQVFMIQQNDKTDFDMIKADTLQMNIFDSSFVSTVSSSGPREMTSFDLYKKIQDMKKSNNSSKRFINNYELELNKKFSIPFGSIFFSILAFPLALIFGRKDGQTLGLVFGIVISVLYWAATLMGQMFGLRSGMNSFLMMWGPNILIGILGFILYLRLKKK